MKFITKFFITGTMIVRFTLTLVFVALFYLLIVNAIFISKPNIIEFFFTISIVIIPIYLLTLDYVIFKVKNRIEKLNEKLYKTPIKIKIKRINQFTVIGYLVLVLLLPLVMISKKIGLPFGFDAYSALSLAFFLVAEFRYVSFKNDLSKEANRVHHRGHDILHEKMLSNNQKEVDELRKSLEFTNEIKDDSFSVFGYEKVDGYDKISSTVEMYIMSGIFISTIAWGFLGSFNDMRLSEVFYILMLVIGSAVIFWSIFSQYKSFKK